MANPDWGTKHSCQNCGAKYYDLKRSPAVCPKCGTEFNPDALLKSRRAKPAPAKPAKTAEKTEDLEVVEGEDELADDDSVIEDTSDLGEDDEDMSDVVVGDDDKEET